MLLLFSLLHAFTIGFLTLFVPTSTLKMRGRLQSLKWNFTTPREEYVQQLQNQFKPVVSRELLCQLFSDDFKDHCKAIDTLHKVCGAQLPV